MMDIGLKNINKSVNRCILWRELNTSYEMCGQRCYWDDEIITEIEI